MTLEPFHAHLMLFADAYAVYGTPAFSETSVITWSEPWMPSYSLNMYVDRLSPSASVSGKVKVLPLTLERSHLGPVMEIFVDAAQLMVPIDVW